MKSLLAVAGKHIWWALLVSYFLLWEFDRPSWDKVNETVTNFFHDTNKQTKGAREDLKDIKKDISH